MKVLQKTEVQLGVKRVKDGSDSYVTGRLTGGIVTWPTFQFLCSLPPSRSPCHHLPVYLLFLLQFLKLCTSFSLPMMLSLLGPRLSLASPLWPPSRVSCWISCHLSFPLCVSFSLFIFHIHVDFSCPSFNPSPPSSSSRCAQDPESVK